MVISGILKTCMILCEGLEIQNQNSVIFIEFG